ncbi:MAG TPA: hypothetical protein VMD91_09205 [Candidatus Sulfotelmatobacter sp.]|nr:hypothetical protein [Candidatus Sulfotelmatobacter sp.]
MDWSFLEGSRAFDVTWGLVSGALCLTLALPILWWSLPAHRRSLFGRALDARGNLQLAYGIFAMAMAFTDAGCRLIPHGDLPWVHPTFFVMTLALVVGLGPRVVAVGRARTSA